jgi:hypothetical protein
VPEQHVAQQKLPSISGSSGHLVIERICPQGEEPHWPGQVFAEAGLDYEDAMLQYALATRGRLLPHQFERKPTLQEPTRYRQRIEERVERYQVREQRKREDLAWKAAKTQWRHTRQTHQALPLIQRFEQQAAYELANQAWKTVRQQHLEMLEKRQQEDQVWHQRNRQREVGSTQAAEARTWIAVLVMTDNCTRQCLGLPLFRSGSKLSSTEMVKALGALLPKELQFMISDQGTHFRSNAFATLAEEADFIHVPVYRHRPQSNGIAERFVLTLKSWLRSKAWTSVEALQSLLAEFRAEYNDRTHQGLAIPGLSPNEFAKRIWLM